MGCVQTKDTHQHENNKIPQIEINDCKAKTPIIAAHKPLKTTLSGSWHNLHFPKQTSSSCLRHSFSLKFVNPGRKKSFSCRSMLTPDDKEILQKHWLPTVLTQEPDLFMKVMIESMRDCPKILDVVSCNMRPCGAQFNGDMLSHWPKLKKITKGNCHFFTRQIVLNKLEDSVIRREAEILGPIHLQYAPFGFEPFFLDIWQTKAVALIATLAFPTEVDQILFVKAFKTLCKFICTLMVMEVEDSYQSMMYLEETIKTLNC